MTELDRRTFRAMGMAMASTNGYRARQSSGLYPTDGDMIDWTYARQRIFSFTFELYPRGGTAQRYYPPDEIIGRETRRNRDAVLYLMGRAICPYAALGTMAVKMNCGPFFDDLEIARGWRVDPDGSDTASDGRWQRGDPVRSDLQLGSAVSGRSVLITGRGAGHDVDDGRTTVRSPLIRLPADGVATLRLRYWVGLAKGATAADGLRVHIVDGDGDRLATLLEVAGTGAKRKPDWRALAKPLPENLAGRRVAIELEAVDAGAGAIVEAAVDQVRDHDRLAGHRAPTRRAAAAFACGVNPLRCEGARPTLWCCTIKTGSGAAPSRVDPTEEKRMRRFTTASLALTIAATGVLRRRRARTGPGWR